MLDRLVSCALAISLVVGCSNPPPIDPVAALGSDADPVCWDDGTCVTCTDDGSCTQCTADATCTVCNELWQFTFDPPPVVTGTDVVFAPPGTYTIEILADGSAVIRDAAGKVVEVIKNFAVKVDGQWLIRMAARIPDYLK